jgi:ribokinase
VSAARPPQVLVVGSVNVDLIMNVPELPEAGETVLGGRYAQGGGGKGANAAVAAARAGAEVRLVGAVGDDEHGRGEHAALAAHGVSVDEVATIAGAATGVAFVLVAADGANQIAVASGANDHVDPARAAAAIAGLDAQRAAVLLGFEVPDGALIAAAEAAAARGVPVVLNPAPARPLAAALAELHPILTPNEHEVVALAGAGAEAGAEAAARTLAVRTGAPVVVTLGAAGALVIDRRGEATRVPAPTVDVVDTTGAGDTFSGVLATSLAARRPLLDAVTDAAAAAAHSVTVPGAR